MTDYNFLNILLNDMIEYFYNSKDYNDFNKNYNDTIDKILYVESCIITTDNNIKIDICKDNKNPTYYSGLIYLKQRCILLHFH